MPGNQDGDKNQISLAKASAISWAIKSTQSPTGSEWKWYKWAEVYQAWSRLDWPLNKGGSYRLTPIHTSRNQELKVLGDQWLYTSRVLLLVALKGKGVISGGSHMMHEFVQERPHHSQKLNLKWRMTVSSSGTHSKKQTHVP